MTTDSITKLLSMHGMSMTDGPKVDNSGTILPEINRKADSTGMDVSSIASIGDMGCG